MLQNNSLLAQLKQQLHQQTPRVEGTVRAHAKGYGFLETENKKSYFIPATQMKNVIDGDKVSGQIITKNEKESFEPETLVESSLSEFLGKIDFKNKAMVIIPENVDNIFIKCKFNPEFTQQLKAGDWVKAKLITHALDNDKHLFVAEALQFIAEESSPNLLWLKTLARHNLEASAPIDDSFSLNEAESLLRQDLTEVDFFTIDSKETLDMDDAITITTNENNQFCVSVAIADPSTYFSSDSEINQQAMQRSFTTYLPNYTVSMLPQALANDLCSLKANEKRASVVAKITISPQGEIIHSATEFCLAWIRSKAKLSYDEVSDFIEKDIPLSNDFPSLHKQLTLFQQLATIRTQWRAEHALLFKENHEYDFIFNNENQLINIVKKSKRIAHKIVEEVMVIANQAFTEKISTEYGTAIYNTHNGFENKYLDCVVKLLDEFKINGFNKEQLSSFDGYKSLRKLIDNNLLLEHRLRRYLSMADFSLEPNSHYGMGFDAYATWTSPIRKYGDLVNHRLLKSLILKQPASPLDLSILTNMNERRRAQRMAERDINQKLYCQYLTNKIGQTYTAEIIDINRGGAKVKLLEIGAIAFLPLSLIHPVRNEIIAQPESGEIIIKQQTAYTLLDVLTVTVNEIKENNSSIIVKILSIDES